MFSILFIIFIKFKFKINMRDAAYWYVMTMHSDLG